MSPAAFQMLLRSLAEFSGHSTPGKEDVTGSSAPGGRVVAEGDPLKAPTEASEPPPGAELTKDDVKEIMDILARWLHLESNENNACHSFLLRVKFMVTTYQCVILT